jgi:hypothetical protein
VTRAATIPETITLHVPFRVVIEAWRVDSNTARPHSAHGGLTPAEALRRAAAVGLRSRGVSADRPLPAAPTATYVNPGPSE